MILILSKSEAEKTTNIVIDHLISLGANFFRLNGDDLFSGEMKIDFQCDAGKWNFKIITATQTIHSDSISAVWFRRNFSRAASEIVGSAEEFRVLNLYLQKEVYRLFELFEFSLQHTYWLNRYSASTNKKLEYLAVAAQNDLLVPYSFVTNNSDFLTNQTLNKNFITKPMTEGLLYLHDKKSYPLSIERVTTIPDEEIFFPSFAQEEIDTHYEIRVFYLEGETYSIQIYNEKTKADEIDSRRNFRDQKVRYSKYEIPEFLRKNIRRFMDDINLNCGSLDFIRTLQGDYVFLEVNPVGQIDFVSQIGNYHLEYEIAKTLYGKSKEVS